jgi:hypothetical protein
MGDQVKKYFCPRLIDYVIFVGPKESGPSVDLNNNQQQQQMLDKRNARVPHLLRRYPPQDHEDFSLPPDVVIFCQPEGCDHVKSSLNAYNNPSQTTNSFVFLLTEKDTSRIRYGVCLNFYRPIQKLSSTTTNVSGIKLEQSRANNETDNNVTKTTAANVMQPCAEQGAAAHYQDQEEIHRSNELGCDGGDGGDEQCKKQSQQQISEKDKQQIHLQRKFNSQYYQQSSPGPRATSASKKDQNKITYALNSICIISHHPFFSTFRECLFIMKKYIQACEDRHSNSAYNCETETQPKCRCIMKLRNQRRGSREGNRHPATTVMNHHFTCPYSNPIWSLLTMSNIDDSTISRPMMADVAEIEAWTLRLLSVPVPVPGKTKIELEIMPSSLKPPLLFALPDHTRLSLIDFPLHLPLELLGVETCLQVLTCIILEHKVALQSKDYNALSMSVMAFVTMIYPLEYMFPVIPLLPSYMSSAEQLLLAPTPYIIGFPSSFFKFRPNFSLPNDIWIVDLDTNKVKEPANVEELPPLPNYEGNILKQNLQKILDSMSNRLDTTIQELSPQVSLTSDASNRSLQQTPRAPVPRYAPTTRDSQSSALSSPFKRRSSVAAAGQLLQFAANKLSGNSAAPSGVNHSVSPGNGEKKNRSSPAGSNRSSFVVHNSSVPTFNPLSVLESNDLDAVDVAVRIAMVNFLNSQEVLANFVEHTRTIRLYPRPVVSFQKSSFIQSRAKVSPFLLKLVETQSVEYLAEWALCPDNVAFQRIQTGVFDPAIIGDKPKWYENQLELLRYQIMDTENREFYDEIANLIRDSSGIGSGVTSTVSRFSHYYDDKMDANDFNELDQNNSDYNYENDSPGFQDVNNETASQSTYLSSNIQSPSEAMSRLELGERSDDIPLSLNDVMNKQMRRLSSSSSDSSNASWEDDDRVLQTIPANYQHDVELYPPLRCELEKHYRPCNKLITSLHDARTWLGTDSAAATILDKDSRSQADFDRKSSYDSSVTDDNDELKNVPDSSSCDESVTEEFNFDDVRTATKAEDTPEALEEDGEIKLFESVDSDTIVGATGSDPIGQSAIQCDENNNSTLSKTQKTLDDAVSFEESAGPTPKAQNCGTTTTSFDYQTNVTQNQGNNSDTMTSILNSQKLRVSNGVAKLIDRASSMSAESKLLKQNSNASSPGLAAQSPLPINLGGEQMSAFFDRVTSEARDAVKEAKAAIDAGKIALKTTAIPAADASRQKILKNLQNLGENLLEDRRDSVDLNRSTTDSSNAATLTPVRTDNHPFQHSTIDDNANNQRMGDRSQPTKPTPAPKVGTDFNEIAGRANSMISGWLGSKATAISNRMRDRTRPFGPFPSSKYIQVCILNHA